MLLENGHQINGRFKDILTITYILLFQPEISRKVYNPCSNLEQSIQG